MNMPTDKDMDTMPDSGSTDNKTDSGSTGNTPTMAVRATRLIAAARVRRRMTAACRSSLPSRARMLDGNTVKSSDLFSGKAVTVVNFWFTTCGACVGELGDLDALNKDLSGKGGALIGINAFTLDGNEAAISDAKDVLTQSGATYQTCTSIPAARRASLWRASTPIPPPTWSTAAAASWVIPLWGLSPARRRPMHCKPRSKRTVS